MTDILEVNDLELGLSAGLELSNLQNIPLVFDAQFVSSCLAASYTGDEAVLRAIAHLEQHLGRCISGATCFTELDKKDLVKAIGISEEQVHVIPMGADVEKIQFRKINRGDKTIVFMGNMFFQPNQEGVEYITNLLAPNLLEKYPDLIFRFVGDVPPEIKNQYQNKNIQFTGRLENINDVFKGARVCVTPITTGGGMRTKTLVYMASGVPIVSSPAGTIGIDADDALLLAQSPQEFIKHIDDLLENYELSLNLGQQARHLAETKYSWSAFAEQYEIFYNSVLQNPVAHNEKPILVESDPFWLEETIDKGRFAANQGDPNNIYLLGHGKKVIVPVDDLELKSKLKQFLEPR